MRIAQFMCTMCEYVRVEFFGAMWLLLLLLSLTHLYTHTENIENCLNYSDIFDKIRIFSLYLLFRLTCCVLSMMNYSASISIFRVVFLNFSVFGNSFDWYTHQPLIRALSVQTLHVFIKLLVLWFRNGLHQTRDWNLIKSSVKCEIWFGFKCGQDVVFAFFEKSREFENRRRVSKSFDILSSGSTHLFSAIICKQYESKWRVTHISILPWVYKTLFISPDCKQDWTAQCVDWNGVFFIALQSNVRLKWIVGSLEIYFLKLWTRHFLL